MLSLSLAQLRAHLGRLLATGLAIIIAVGFVVATLVLNQTSKATVYRAVGAQYQNTAAVITADFKQPDATSLDARPELAAEVAKIPGVRTVAVDRSAYTQAKLSGDKGYRLARVASIATDRALQWQNVTAGRLPTADGEVAVGKRRGVTLGSQVILLTRLPDKNGEPGDPVARTATIVGVVDLMGATGAAGPGFEQFFATGAQATAWGATETDELRVAAVAGISADTLVTRIDTTLQRAGAGSLIVHTGQKEAELAAHDVTRDAADLTQILLVFATVALLVCGLVIANTFAVLLAQRTRELALLRCVGASSRQLRRGVLIESLVIGAVASALGVIAGIGLATGVSVLAGQFDSPIPLSGVSVPGLAVAIGMAVGIVITVLAALMPARRATRVSPLAALRPQDPAPLRSRAGLLRRVAGLALLIPSAAALTYGAVQGKLLIALGGGAISFIAVVLLARWVVPPAVALVGRLAGPSGGVPGRLAAANALRNPQRTAATATALLIGVTLTATMVVGAASTRATASSGLDRAFPTDVLIQDSDGKALPAGLEQSLSAVPNVHAALALPHALVQGPNHEEFDVLGIDLARAGSVVRSAVGAGVPAPGTISVPEPQAKVWAKAGSKEGQPVRISAGSRHVDLRVHMVSADTPASIASTDLARIAPKAGIGTIWIKLADGLDADRRSNALDAITSTASDLAPSSYVQGAFEQRDSFDRVVTTLLLIVTGLLAVAVVIAVIGVGNTMALSVLERRQESGLLRALGLTRGQLRWMLLWEAVLIAGVGSLLGTLLGCVYGVLGTSAALSGETTLRVAVPWLQLLLIVAVATAAGALASVLPSRRAARISPVAAIASA